MVECNFSNLESLRIKTVHFIRWLSWEWKSVDYEIITNELKSRKRVEKGQVQISMRDSYPSDLYAKVCDQGRLKLVKFLIP